MDPRYDGRPPANAPRYSDSPNPRYNDGPTAYGSPPPQNYGHGRLGPPPSSHGRPPPSNRPPSASAPPRDANDRDALWPMFKAVDRDNSGQLSEAELQNALVNGDWTKFDPHTVRMMIRMFDADRNGTISFDEFWYRLSFSLSLSRFSIFFPCWLVVRCWLPGMPAAHLAGMSL